MNFTTDLPKGRPQVTYIVASAVHCEKCLNSRVEGPLFRMHAVILNKDGGHSYSRRKEPREMMALQQTLQNPQKNYILCHIRKIESPRASAPLPHKKLKKAGEAEEGGGGDEEGSKEEDLEKEEVRWIEGRREEDEERGQEEEEGGGKREGGERKDDGWRMVEERERREEEEKGGGKEVGSRRENFEEEGKGKDNERREAAVSLRRLSLNTFQVLWVNKILENNLKSLAEKLTNNQREEEQSNSKLEAGWMSNLEIGGPDERVLGNIRQGREKKEEGEKKKFELGNQEGGESKMEHGRRIEGWFGNRDDAKNRNEELARRKERLGNSLFGSEVEKEMRKEGKRDYIGMFGRLLE